LPISLQKAQGFLLCLFCALRFCALAIRILFRSPKYSSAWSARPADARPAGQNGGSSSEAPPNDPACGALPHGSSPPPAGAPPPEPPLNPPPPKPPEPPRPTLSTFAVANFSEGPISSTSSSTTVRFSPSRVSKDRCLSLPCAITRAPLVSDSATF